MRIESCVTSISWIPFASIEGITGFPFSIGLCHYDDPPPQRLDMVQQRNGADRFVNELRAWVSVEDGRIADYGYSGGGYVGVTKVSFGPEIIALPGIHLPILQRPPKILGTSVRFVQTVGGRTALPAPRRSVHRPFFQVAAPAAWTTLALTLHADGSTEHELTGASPFPRHWIYDKDGTLVQCSALIDFDNWYHTALQHTPWGDVDVPALVAEAETPLERDLSLLVTHAARKPPIRRLSAQSLLVEQGDEGREMFLLLDGVLSIEVDGNRLGEVGPGSILGERAYLEGGRRHATLRAITTCRVAVATVDTFPKAALEELAGHHGMADRTAGLSNG